MKVPRLYRFPPKKEKTPLYLFIKPDPDAVILSLFAIIFSIYSFYYSNLRKEHSFKVSYGPIIRMNSKSADRIQEKAFTALFQNLGNQNEVHVSTTYIFTDSLQNAIRFDNYDSAFILKPGEVQLRKYFFRINLDTSALTRKVTSEVSNYYFFKIHLELNVIDSVGEPRVRYILLMKSYPFTNKYEDTIISSSSIDILNTKDLFYSNAPNHSP
jgi:hypothetical protein